MKIALVIGGTGMLAGLTKKLTDDFDVVGVVGRNAAKLGAVQAFSQKIAGYAVDYSDSVGFQAELDRFVSTYGSPQLVVSWIHSTGLEAPHILAEYCQGDFYDVTGNDGLDKDDPSRAREKVIQAMGISYHRVILGHIGNRWLTNQEISDGVYRAIQAAKPEFVVGEP